MRHEPTAQMMPQKKRVVSFTLTTRFLLAGPTRLELATSGVTGRRSNQLNYDPSILVGETGIEPVTLGL